MISYAVDFLLFLLLFSIFGFLHSFLASDKTKKFIVSKIGSRIAFYRLTYNLLSLILFFFIFSLLPRPSVTIYDLPNPWDLIILVPQFAALAGLIWTAKYFSVTEFIGIEQIKRWLDNTYNPDHLDEQLTLKIGGPFKYVRHPVYFFTIAFLLFRPTMDLFYLYLVIFVIAYFYVGSIYEEKKLIREFGSSYLDYKNQVPRIFPVKFLRPYNSRTL